MSPQESEALVQDIIFCSLFSEIGTGTALTFSCTLQGGGKCGKGRNRSPEPEDPTTPKTQLSKPQLTLTPESAPEKKEENPICMTSKVYHCKPHIQPRAYILNTLKKSKISIVKNKNKKNPTKTIEDG